VRVSCYIFYLKIFIIKHHCRRRCAEITVVTWSWHIYREYFSVFYCWYILSIHGEWVLRGERWAIVMFRILFYLFRICFVLLVGSPL